MVHEIAKVKLVKNKLKGRVGTINPRRLQEKTQLEGNI